MPPRNPYIRRVVFRETLVIADLIPAEFFAGQATWLLWLTAAASIALLAVGGDRTVSAAAAMARLLGVPKAIIGATVVSLGTTTPEMCVSVAAALRGNPDLALGNAVGSIIVDTGLIFGLCCLIRPLPMDRFVLNRHGWIQLGSGALLTAACVVAYLAAGGEAHGVLPRAFGVLLVALLIGYLYMSVYWARSHPLMMPPDENDSPMRGRVLAMAAFQLLLLAVGLGLVVLGSELLVGSVKTICERYQVPPSVLAVTLVAFGTSVPELVTGIAALVKRHEDISVGNIIGADVLNVFFVTGIANVASPLVVETAFLWLYLPTMMVLLMMFQAYAVLGRQQFRRWQGGLLLAVYVASVYLTVRWGAL